jgi:hypothetical protein
MTIIPTDANGKRFIYADEVTVNQLNSWATKDRVPTVKMNFHPTRISDQLAHLINHYKNHGILLEN